MDNKLSELSKPVGFVSDRASTQLKEGDPASIRPFFDVQGSKPLYSQEYVSAMLAENEEKEKLLISNAIEYEISATDLLAELEAKDKRIAELEAIATEYAGKFQKAQDAAKHLIIMNDSAQAEIAHLKTLLATPVRLPGKTSDLDSWDGGWDSCLEECADVIRAAGFTVEGDE
nr:hypothetical protein [uncultured Serratia sp.]